MIKANQNKLKGASIGDCSHLRCTAAEGVRGMDWPFATSFTGGAEGLHVASPRIDPHVGGRYLNCMRSQDGRASFREIVEPERLVMTDSFTDGSGNIVTASYCGLSEGFRWEC